ncbi:MAG: thiamine pyrophosphate-binding protein [Okeania sp. SIO3C4]|nr:thiamine pyrophosphate-binding protein [Okeania sp. SIO3C4]
MGEFSSFWSSALIPQRGLIHVDIDQNVLGVVYPDVETYWIVSDIQAFVDKLMPHLQQSSAITFPRAESNSLEVGENQVRPNFLMQEIQKAIVEGSKAVVMSEAGNSFAWATHCLRFQEPGRYRVSTSFGSMGHAVTGILGAALICGKAVGIVGDGAMLMNGGEINTAVKYQIPVVWIILNDGRYNMVAQGASQQGFQGVDTMLPVVDFVKFAQAMGADGVRVNSEIEVSQALVQAMSSSQPFVVDVAIDPSVKSPITNRIESLIVQGSIQIKGGYVK